MVPYLYNNDDLMFVVELLHEVLTTYRVPYALYLAQTVWVINLLNKHSTDGPG